MIDPKTVCIITPTRDGQVCTDFAGGLASCAGLYGGVSFVVGMSVVSLARCLVVNAFLQREQFEHLIMIDADIGFTRQDMEYLLEEQPLKIREEGSTPDDPKILTTHKVVVAEYGKRSTGHKQRADNAKFGLGFARVHRSVFADLQEVRTADGDLMVNPFMWNGEMVHDYFPCGATPAHHWMSEDHGFFMLCQLAGITPRVETRTNLAHWGRVATYADKTTFNPANLTS